MSYDGGVVVKINNDVLRTALLILDEQGCFEGGYIKSFTSEKKRGDEKQIYSFYYAYYDCAYVTEYPETIDDVASCLLDLILQYEEEMTDEQVWKLERVLRAPEVKDGYRYVEWWYYPPEWEDFEEPKVFVYGKKPGKKKKPAAGHNKKT